jgi:hypothetical protein
MLPQKLEGDRVEFLFLYNLKKKIFCCMCRCSIKKNVFQSDTILTCVEAVTVQNPNYVSLPPTLQKIKVGATEP